MPAKKQTSAKLLEIEQEISAKSLEDLPLFFVQRKIQQGDFRRQVRRIGVALYRSDAFESRAYYKAISKMG